MAENLDLAEIINGCKQGREESFSQLVDLYSSRCYGYFYRLTGNRDLCDDLLSELFIKLVERIGTYKGGSFDGWIFRVASNIFYDYLRKKQRDQKLIEKQKDIVVESVGHNIRHNESDRIDKLQVQLKKLDEETRELIMMRFYSELSFKEMAEMRGEPIGTTLTKLHRGLKKLMAMMEK